MSSDAESFSSFLQGLSERPQRRGTESRFSDEALLVEPTAQANAGETSRADFANSVLTLLQAVLPGAGPQVSVASADVNRQETDASTALSLAQALEMPEDGDAPTLTVTSKLAVSVRHQETHFRPVLDNLDTALQQADAVEGDVLPQIQLGSDPLRKSANPGGSERQSDAKEIRFPNQPSAVTQASPEHEAEGEGAPAPSGGQLTARRSGDTLEPRKEVSAHAVKSGEPISLPTETLHRIASAIKSDLQAASGSVPPQSLQGSEATRTLSIKASESALRVLHLQLHPADLGSVTIKMRLAGDSLEMELHVEREDTAQLLRHDSEKLSALLRGSGYRPDIISVHVVDGAIQDRVAPRTQIDMQMQGQSFPQGGTSQGGHSREQEHRYGRAGAEHHQDVENDQAPGGRSTGGVYL